jgi:hypothetical protein
LLSKLSCVQPHRAKEQAAERNETAMAPLIRRNEIIYFSRGGSRGPTRGIGGSLAAGGGVLDRPLQSAAMAHLLHLTGGRALVARRPSAAFPFGVEQASGRNVETSRSGRIEARTGLRMMPTFPRSPLSFRTASFPRYGWKAAFRTRPSQHGVQLKPAPGIRWPSPGLRPSFARLVTLSLAPH